MAKILASRDTEVGKTKKHSPHSPSGSRSDKSAPISPPRLSPQERFQQHVTNEVISVVHQRKAKSPLLGAASPMAEEPGPSRLCYNNDVVEAAMHQVEDEDEDDLRKRQEEKDAVSTYNFSCSVNIYIYIVRIAYLHYDWLSHFLLDVNDGNLNLDV